MNLGARQTLMGNNSSQLFVDPSTCNEYICHSTESDTAIIRLTELIHTSNGGPYSAQLILTSLQTLYTDKKFLTINDVDSGEVFGMHIINGGWRFAIMSQTEEKDPSTQYSFASINGQHGSGHGYIQVTNQKINFVSNALDGTVLINNMLIQDYPTISIPKDSPYYWTAHYSYAPFEKAISHIDIMGKYTHDHGNMYAKFYHFRLYDKDMNMICNLWPKIQNGEAGIYDKCTNKFWSKTHLNGSFIFGTD